MLKAHNTQLTLMRATGAEYAQTYPKSLIYKGVQAPTGILRSVSLSAVGVVYLGVFINL